MTNAVCSGPSTPYSASDITANMICAHDLNGKGACQGDIGGPMLIKEGNHYSIIGKGNITLGPIGTTHKKPFSRHCLIRFPM